MGLFAAFVFSRVLQDLLPQRPRPIHSGDPTFVAPFGADPQAALANWSSFPSDHAVVGFALATIVFRISRPLGIACYLWSTFIVCLPRVYGGLHYASDVVAGAFIGAAAVAVILRIMLPQSTIVALALRSEERVPGVFYCLTFIFSYQIATMFDDIRVVARELMRLLLA